MYSPVSPILYSLASVDNIQIFCICTCCKINSLPKLMTVAAILVCKYTEIFTSIIHEYIKVNIHVYSYMYM